MLAMSIILAYTLVLIAFAVWLWFGLKFLDQLLADVKRLQREYERQAIIDEQQGIEPEAPVPQQPTQPTLLNGIPLGKPNKTRHR